MRIAQVSPLYERVPPRYYGGTERIVSYLTEELVGQGHEVTLFASGDSKTKGRLVAASEVGLRLNPETADYNPYHVLQLEQVMQEAEAFDIIHFHTDYPHFPLSRRLQTANVTTFHDKRSLSIQVFIYKVSGFTFIELPQALYGKCAQRLCRVRWTLDDQQGSVFQLGDGEPSPKWTPPLWLCTRQRRFCSEHTFSLREAHHSPVWHGLPTRNGRANSIVKAARLSWHIHCSR